jgi:hypothetical protein
MLPLQATAATGDHDYYLIENVEPGSLPGEWRGLVLDDPSNGQAFNRRQLEVVAMLELAAAIKAGEMFVTGSLSYDRFLDRLPRETADPAAIAAYAASRGWGEGEARMFTRPPAFCTSIRGRHRSKDIADQAVLAPIVCAEQEAVRSERATHRGSIDARLGLDRTSAVGGATH